jgi:hypothetical protein
VALV